MEPVLHLSISITRESAIHSSHLFVPLSWFLGRFFNSPFLENLENDRTRCRNPFSETGLQNDAEDIVDESCFCSGSARSSEKQQAMESVYPDFASRFSPEDRLRTIPPSYVSDSIFPSGKKKGTQRHLSIRRLYLATHLVIIQLQNPA